MAEEVKRIVTELESVMKPSAERCSECNQPINNGDHEKGICGFRERLTKMATQANGGVEVWA